MVEWATSLCKANPDVVIWETPEELFDAVQNGYEHAGVDADEEEDDDIDDEEEGEDEDEEDDEDGEDELEEDEEEEEFIDEEEDSEDDEEVKGLEEEKEDEDLEDDEEEIEEEKEADADEEEEETDADEDDSDDEESVLPFDPHQTTAEYLIYYANTLQHDERVLGEIVRHFFHDREEDWEHVRPHVWQINRIWKDLVHGSSEEDQEEEDEVDPNAAPAWPAQARYGQETALRGDDFWDYEQGMLSFMGYRVGESSTLTEQQRRAILAYVYEGQLPNINSVDYMSEWDMPDTGERLKKMADSLATFARNAKRRRGKNLSTAIARWEADLAFLKEKYYRYTTMYRWSWPQTR